MGYYSDPTASRALGNINCEFSRFEKKAKALRKLYREGRISEQELDQAHSLFGGIFTHVLDHVLAEPDEEDE